MMITLYNNNIYWHDWTHPEALKRRHRARHQRRRSNQRLFGYVKHKLRDDWSPEIIAEKLKIDYPNNDEMRVSYETIYHWICSDAKGDGTLYHHLRRKRKKRRRQGDTAREDDSYQAVSVRTLCHRRNA